MNRTDLSRVDFYTKVADPQAFACQLAATVLRKKERLLVWLNDERELDAFSRRLWSLGDTLFIPHCALDAPEAADTPIWLATRLPAGLEHPVLLNLGSAVPDEAGRFDRILEIVGRDEASLATARERFRYYRELGFAIEHHDMGHK